MLADGLDGSDIRYAKLLSVPRRSECYLNMYDSQQVLDFIQFDILTVYPFATISFSYFLFLLYPSLT